ncbi:MAG: hypothetical protein ABR562_04240 [Thermoplasmatota archaeon]|nr:hypothetical protein [Halobacteriales archaeon]
MPRRAAAIAFVAVLALAPTLAPASADTFGPVLRMLSYDPVAGDYTMIVRIDRFTLVPAAQGDRDGQGHLLYLLNGQPCAGLCAGGQDFATTSTHFTYHRLVTGDNVTVELRSNSGKPLSPPVRVTAIVAAAGSRCVEPVEGGCARWASFGPLLAVASGIPNAGDYTLALRVDRFTLLPPGPGPAEDVDTGFVVYTYNGAPCIDSCANGAAAATTATTFTFHAVRLGDRIGAELLRPDGSHLEPRTAVSLTVARPQLKYTSGVAQEGNYTMRLNVTGFTLAAPGTPPNAGTGHILYLVKAKGSAEFVPAPCAAAETAASSFPFCGLEPGDQVKARLVDARGNALSPPVETYPLDVRKVPKEGFLSPAIGPALAFLLVALAAVRRR